MLQRVLVSCAVMAALTVSSFAQTGFADLIDHIHLAAPDQAKAVEWYHAHLGAEPTPEGPDRAMLGTTWVRFTFWVTPDKLVDGVNFEIE